MSASQIEHNTFDPDSIFSIIRMRIQDLCVCSCRQNAIIAIPRLCSALRQSWREAAFSPLPDHALKRYFSFQLESIRDILDTSPFPELPGQEYQIKDEFLTLINYLFQYFKNFLDTDLISPTAYRNYTLASLDGIAEELSERLKHAAIDEDLRNIIESYAEEMTRKDINIRDTYH